MPAFAKLSLTNHGRCITESFKESLNTIPTDLQILCQDGKVQCHKVMLASQCNSQALFRDIKYNPEETISISVPDALKSQVENFIQLLYTGKIQGKTHKEILQITELTQLFCFKKLNCKIDEPIVAANIGLEEAKIQIELTIEEVEKKKRTTIVPPNINEDILDVGPRRSKRPRKTKHLDDYETPFKQVPDNVLQPQFIGKYLFHKYTKMIFPDFMWNFF